MTTIRSTQQAKPCWIILLLDHEMCAISAVNSPAVRWLFDGIYLFHDTYCSFIFDPLEKMRRTVGGMALWAVRIIDPVTSYDVWACKTEWRLEQPETNRLMLLKFALLRRRSI